MEYPQSEQDIYLDWSGRRTALLKALTDDVEDLYRQCNPEKENLCLYGGRDGNWSVEGPAEEVPPELPEPCLGINFARDGMQKRDWLTLVAVHSDSWLLAVAFFYGVKLDSASRLRLFKQLNSHPTLFEVVNERNKGRTPTMPQHLMMQGGEARKRKAETLPVEMSRPTEAPESSGRLLTAEDISPALTGRAAELYWPDNHLWYAVRIESVDLTTRAAKITYATGEEEDLELEEILKDGHMALL